MITLLVIISGLLGFALHELGLQGTDLGFWVIVFLANAYYLIGIQVGKERN